MAAVISAISANEGWEAMQVQRMILLRWHSMLVSGTNSVLLLNQKLHWSRLCKTGDVD